jgi:hypothetical protein
MELELELELELEKARASRANLVAKSILGRITTVPF